MQKFDRTFQVWEYWVGHAQLVLRSLGSVLQPSDSSLSRNVDLQFVSVQYLELPTLLSELEIVDPVADECRKVREILGRDVPAQQVYVLATPDRRYLIVAGNMSVSENNLSPFKSNLERV
jgi:hypothetical protein